MSIPLVDLKAQYAAIKPDVDAAIARVIGNTSFIMGDEVRAFERDFAAFCKAKHCIGMASGTAAIHLALFAAGLGARAEVITTTFTVTASPEPICHAGARPGCVAARPQTDNLHPRLTNTAPIPP